MFFDVAYPFISLLMLLVAFLYLLLPVSVSKKPLYLLAIGTACSVALLLPLGGIPAFYFLRGYIGDPSMTSSIFFGAYALKKGLGWGVYQPIEARKLAFIVVVIGLFLYPMAAGLGQFDPYQLGYNPHALLVLLLCSSLYFWHKSYIFLLLVTTSVVVGFTFDLLESNNLWDYLLDVTLWLICIATLLSSSFRSLRKRTSG